MNFCEGCNKDEKGEKEFRYIRTRKDFTEGRNVSRCRDTYGNDVCIDRTRGSGDCIRLRTKTKTDSAGTGNNYFLL